MTNLEWLMKTYAHEGIQLCRLRVTHDYERKVERFVYVGDKNLMLLDEIPSKKFNEAVRLKKITSTEKGAMILVWLDMEHEERPPLDDTERRYLEGVLRPFKSCNVRIRKIDNQKSNREHIEFVVTPYSVEWTRLPDFQYGTMYTGMKQHWIYTPGELGLFRKGRK